MKNSLAERLLCRNGAVEVTNFLHKAIMIRYRGSSWLMQDTLVKTYRDRSFLIAILAHALLFLLLSFSLNFSFSPKISMDKAPQLYLPSYLYQGEPQMARSMPKTTSQHHQEEHEAAKNGILKPRESGARTQKAEQQQQQSKEKAQALQSRSRRPTLDKTKKSRVSEAVNLVGEQKIVKPLIELLGRSLGRYLKYPKMAYEFNLKGTSYIGFNLHPNGLVTDVQVVKSSGASILDDAAKQGVQDMSPVLDVKPYVDHKQFLVVGVIFN